MAINSPLQLRVVWYAKINVYAWDHEDDARRCVAPSLKRYLEGWLTGKIQP
jgi:hypothetical protein